MNSKQKRAAQLHLKRLERQLLDAERQYEQLRSAFPTYTQSDGGLLMTAARFVDETRRARDNFRATFERVAH